MTNRQRLLNALALRPNARPPIWLMRQAGRCLPEYRALKEKYSFRQLVTTPELAAEVTLQPVRRFSFDAAILFCDILVVPEAMGVPFQFTDTGGLQMETLKDSSQVARLNSEGVAGRLQYVAQALGLVKKQLGESAGLLGFAGSPWTIANFMLEGGGAVPYSRALSLFRNERSVFDRLCEKIVRATTDYLNMQINCGVDALQIFDSLGGLLPQADFEAASARWMREIIAGLGGRVPVIVYSKGARDWAALARTGAKIISVDHAIDIAEVRRELPETLGIQGNLDPLLLSEGEPGQVRQAALELLEKMRGRNGYIFNLGHGVPPDARLECLQTLAQTVASFT